MEYGGIMPPTCARTRSRRLLETADSLSQLNVASLFDRFGWAIRGGAFWFRPTLKIGPVPTLPAPLVHSRASRAPNSIA
jgi:hypothetical protein